MHTLAARTSAAVGKTDIGYDASVITSFTPCQAQFGLTTGQISSLSSTQLKALTNAQLAVMR